MTPEMLQNCSNSLRLLFFYSFRHSFRLTYRNFKSVCNYSCFILPFSSSYHSIPASNISTKSFFIGIFKDLDPVSFLWFDKFALSRFHIPLRTSSQKSRIIASESRISESRSRRFWVWISGLLLFWVGIINLLLHLNSIKIVES